MRPSPQNPLQSSKNTTRLHVFVISTTTDTIIWRTLWEVFSNLFWYFVIYFNFVLNYKFVFKHFFTIFNRAFQSVVVFSSGQKMALRAFYFIRAQTKALKYYYINRSQRHLLAAFENTWLGGSPYCHQLFPRPSDLLKCIFTTLAFLQKQ